MTVKELLEKLNALIIKDPSISELKICGKDNEFRYFFPYTKIEITEHDFNDNIFFPKDHPEIEKVVLLN